MTKKEQPITDWPKPSREDTLGRNAERRRTTCVGPDDLSALRQSARFGFDRFCSESSRLLCAGAVEPVVAADDAGNPLVPRQVPRRRAAELFRSAVPSILRT